MSCHFNRFVLSLGACPSNAFVTQHPFSLLCCVVLRRPVWPMRICWKLRSLMGLPCLTVFLCFNLLMLMRYSLFPLVFFCSFCCCNSIFFFRFLFLWFFFSFFGCATHYPPVSGYFLALGILFINQCCLVRLFRFFLTLAFWDPGSLVSLDFIAAIFLYIGLVFRLILPVLSFFLYYWAIGCPRRNVSASLVFCFLRVTWRESIGPLWM